jgi:hypothetical protein
MSLALTWTLVIITRKLKAANVLKNEIIGVIAKSAFI